MFALRVVEVDNRVKKPLFQVCAITSAFTNLHFPATMRLAGRWFESSRAYQGHSMLWGGFLLVRV